MSSYVKHIAVDSLMSIQNGSISTRVKNLNTNSPPFSKGFLHFYSISIYIFFFNFLAFFRISTEFQSHKSILSRWVLPEFLCYYRGKKQQQHIREVVKLSIWHVKCLHICYYFSSHVFIFQVYQVLSLRIKTAFVRYNYMDQQMLHRL